MRNMNELTKNNHNYKFYECFLSVILLPSEETSSLLVEYGNNIHGYKIVRKNNNVPSSLPSLRWSLTCYLIHNKL